MVTLRSAEEGRIVLSKIEEQVGIDTLADWIVEGAINYKSKEIKAMGFGCMFNYLLGYVEDRYRDRRHQIIHREVSHPEEIEI